jgi:hypothetical protein
MTLTPDDLIEDENYSQFWREQVETPNALDNAFPYSVALDDVLGDICPKDTALDSFWLSDIDPDPWIPDDQRLNKISTLEVIEDHNHDGQIESGLSTSSSSNLSTPSLEGDCSRLVDIPLKNVEPNGAQWEHVENVHLEPNPDEILRRRSLDSLRAEPVPSADREAIVSAFHKMPRPIQTPLTMTEKQQVEEHHASRTSEATAAKRPEAIESQSRGKAATAPRAWSPCSQQMST